MSTSTMHHFTPSPTEKYYRSSVLQKINHIFDRILRRCFPKLKKNKAIFRPLEGEARKYGDYVCLNVLEICEELRQKNPDLFDERKPKDIAMEIIRELEFENTDMISKHSIQLHDIGVITFKLNGSWISKSVEKMVINGIGTCAPLIYEREARAVFLSRTNTQLIPPTAGDMLRADFIKDALTRIFLYSGIDILDAGVSPSNTISKEGQIIRMHERCNKPDIMVYITPDLQREHIQHCFSAARSSKSRAALTCCGYRSFIKNPEEELSDLWQHYLPLYPSISKLAKDAGYSTEGFFVCALKFSFLKSHRLAECIFDIDDILNEEGNTFRYVLKTRALICSVIKNSRGTCLFESKESLAGKEERELGFHLVQFTGVIEKACAGLVPNCVCDYLCDLSKLFTSYYNKVWPEKEPILGLCKAAEVVMDKCFDLLGITPGFSQEEIISSIISSSVRRGPCRELAEARCKYLNSRFEIFSMNLDVADLTLDECEIFGTVWVIDTFGARADGWTMSDNNDCCFVTYFKREWHNPLGTFNGSCIPFGDPSCRRSVPVSSSVEVHVLVQVSSKNKDRYYKICYVPHVENFSDFWAGQGKVKSGTLQFDSNAGLVGLNYTLLKEAVDASMELTFSSPSDVSLQVCGSIMAYYEDGEVKDNDGILGELKAVLFRTKKSELNGNQVPLDMHKSVLAVPADGCLMIEAFLMDVKTKEVIVDKMMEYRARPGNADNWCIKWKECSFNLKVAWSEFTAA